MNKLQRLNQNPVLIPPESSDDSCADDTDDDLDYDPDDEVGRRQQNLMDCKNSTVKLIFRPSHSDCWKH